VSATPRNCGLITRIASTSSHTSRVSLETVVCQRAGLNCGVVHDGIIYVTSSGDLQRSIKSRLPAKPRLGSTLKVATVIEKAGSSADNRVKTKTETCEKKMKAAPGHEDTLRLH